MYKKLILTTVLVLSVMGLVNAQNNTTLVNNLREFSEAASKVSPGETIILKNGVWKNARLVISAKGTKEQPILVKAETAGEVILTGSSSLNIAGEFITVDGLWFKDGQTQYKSVVSFRKNSTEFASNCRLTNCTISYFNPIDSSMTTHWVDLWGKNNRVDHNNFTGKTTHGTTLVVWLKGEEHIQNNHRIDHNFFGLRPDLGVNGGETIRIGTSANSMKSSQTIVENNTFKHCNGEVEIISNKSNDNIYRNNLFLESQGTITLRHGNNALVENNVFIGNNKPETGGIRVINAGHIVRNNLLIGLTGDDLRAPISVMNGIPNSPLNRYHQVKDVEIVNNTIINSTAVEFCVGKDDEKTLPPINSLFANNVFLNESGSKSSVIHGNVTGIKFTNNFVDETINNPDEVFNGAKIDWNVIKGVPVPLSTSEQLRVEKTPNAPEYDIVNLKRDPFIAGAFNYNNRRFPQALLMKTGPVWEPNIVAPEIKIVSKTIAVKPGLKTLSKALKNAGLGDVLKLETGEYLEQTTIKVKGNITIEGSTEGQTLIKAADELSKPLNYFFRVNEKSSLTLKNLTLDGEHSTTVKYAVVSPEENKFEKYNVYIDNCTFKNFKNKDGGSVYKAYKGTFADTISIKNSRFENNYRGLNLSYQKDKIGKYNAEVIIIENTAFKNIEEFAVNFQRNGLNPLLKGGELIIKNCVFSKVANSEKGKIITAKGINKVLITTSVFQNSYEALNPILLKGSHQIISNCLIHNSGSIKVAEGAIKEGIISKNPKWEDKQLFIPSEKSYLLKKNNKVEHIGLIQK